MSGNSVIGKAAFAAVFALAMLTVANPAFARHWKQTPAGQAMDYAEIVDHKEKDLVVLLWMAGPAFPAVNKDGLLDKYIIIGVAHAKLGMGAELNSVPVDALEASDGSGNALKPVKRENYPPMIAGMATIMKSMMSSSLGPLGKGMELFVFEAPSSVNACKPGKLVVPFIGESYSWDTPIPGCPKP